MKAFFGAWLAINIGIVGLGCFVIAISFYPWILSVLLYLGGTAGLALIAVAKTHE